MTVERAGVRPTVTILGVCVMRMVVVVVSTVMMPVSQDAAGTPSDTRCVDTREVTVGIS